MGTSNVFAIVGCPSTSLWIKGGACEENTMTSLFHLKNMTGRKEGRWEGNSRVKFALPEERKTLGPQSSPEGL